MRKQVSAGAARYALASEDIRVERLADLTLVFHRLSSETHILSPDMEAIFSQIPPQGADSEAILGRLKVAHGGIESGDDAAMVIAARLDELAALGIVRRIA